MFVWSQKNAGKGDQILIWKTSNQSTAEGMKSHAGIVLVNFDLGFTHKKQIEDWWLQQRRNSAKKELLLTVKVCQIKPEDWKRESYFKIWLTVVDIEKLCRRSNEDLLKQKLQECEILKEVEEFEGTSWQLAGRTVHLKVQANEKTRSDWDLEGKVIWVYLNLKIVVFALKYYCNSQKEIANR